MHWSQTSDGEGSRGDHETIELDSLIETAKIVAGVLPRCCEIDQQVITTISLESQLEDYLADLQVLVAIDSGTYDKAGGNLVNDWLAARLVRAGFTIQRFPQTDTADHLLARLRGAGQAKILLLGHSDTVYPRGAARPLQQVGDRLMGPGACDMKAGLLSGIYAIEALQRQGFDDFDTLIFLCVADEEVDERNSIPLILETIRGCDAVLTLEAARENGDIVTARKGNAVLRVTARGKSAHAGVEPEKGRNAINGLMRRLLQVESLARPAAGVTINVGTIAGGTLPNVVPDRAEASIDIRAFEQGELDAALARIQAIFDHPEDDGISYTLQHRLASPPMPRTAEVANLERLAIQAARRLGFELRGASTGGTADSAFAAQAGVPVLDGLGPIGGLDHGPDEYILKSSIVPRTALLAELIRLICGVQNG